MEIEFDNLNELKKRITPALNTKLKELKKNNYKIATTEDIWNYLIKTKCEKSKNLTIYDIVNDILNTENEEIEEYAIRSVQNDENKPRS